MRKRTAPVDRIARIPSPLGDPARERRVHIAYRAYVLKALRRFELEGKAESTGQPRTPMSDAVNQPATRGASRSSES